MKKYLLGLFAVVLAIGFSAFIAPAKKAAMSLDNYYWFSISSGEGDESAFTNENATFVYYGPEAPSSGCSGTGYNCMVRFSPGDVLILEEEQDAVLDDNDGANPKTPTVIGRERGTP